MIEVLAVRTPTLPPATHTNCYRIGHAVIDPASPYPEEQARLAEWAGPVRKILITHHHADHVGGVAALAAATGAEVYAHTDAIVAFPVHHRLVDGDRIDTGAGVLVAHHTPGHADGHLAYQVEGTGEVVAGDLVAGVGTIVLIPPEGNLSVYLDSLARIRALAARLWPAHGPPCPASLADDYVRHRHMRTGQFRATLAALGPSTPEAIADAVYREVPGADLRLAAQQVRTHLAWLQDRGEVSVAEGTWSLA